MRPPTMTSITQRLKDLSETNENDEGLVWVALQKTKVAALDAPAPKKTKKKAQPVSEPWVSVIPSSIRWHIKTRVTKANPEIGDKEWAVSFTGNKEDPTSCSSDSESTTPILPLRKYASSTQPSPNPSPLHLDRFKRAAPRELLADAQRFLLAFINYNPTPAVPFPKVLFSEQVAREIIVVQHPSECYMTMPPHWLAPGIQQRVWPSTEMTLTQAWHSMQKLKDKKNSQGHISHGLFAKQRRDPSQEMEPPKI